MLEYDLKMMALAIFLPFAFALLSLLFPGRWKEPVKWFALFGAAATLTLSLCLLVDYYALLDSHLDPAGRPLHSPETSLEWRLLEAEQAAAKPVPGPRLSNDWVARYKWIDSLGIEFAVGLDGLSLALIILTAFITLFAVIASWNVDRYPKFYLALLLVSESGAIGSFLATNLFLFFAFFAAATLSTKVLIVAWGSEKSRSSTSKFSFYQIASGLNTVGFLLIFIAIFSLHFIDVRDFVDQNIVTARAEELRLWNPRLSVEEARVQVFVNTLDIATLSRVGRAAAVRLFGNEDRLTAWKPLAEQRKEPELHYLLGRGATLPEAKARFGQRVFSSTYQYALFVLLFVGFAVKPLCIWLAAVLAEAPTGVLMIMAGALLNLGGYGLLRFAYPLCPYAAEQLAVPIAILAIFGIAVGAWRAARQTDLKRLLACVSFSQMGLVLLGIAVWSGGIGLRSWALAMNGAAFLMVAQGITMAGLLFAAGLLADRGGSTDIRKFGGLWNSMPGFGILSGLLICTAMAIPGFCVFIGLFAVLEGAWNFGPPLAIISLLAMAFNSLTLFRAWRAIFLNPKEPAVVYADINLREAIVLFGFVVPAVGLGIYPNAVMSWLEPNVTQIAESLSRVKN